MEKSEEIILMLIAISIVVSIYFYPQMPEKMVSHWGISGGVNGYMPKFWGLFLMPIISAVMLLLFMFIPKIDPLKENIKKFGKYFNGFIVLVVVFLLYLHALVILWNLGFKFNMNVMLPPAFGILFYYCGVLCENAKRNWSIGIRTPWTLSNDIVWNKTHKLGGKLFKIAGIIALLGILVPQYSIWLTIVPAIVLTIYIYIYSYYEYKKQKKTGKKK